AGTVDQIGLKTTRLRALSGEEVSVPNGELLKTRVHNYKRMADRRAVNEFRIPFTAPAEAIADVAGILREAIEAQPTVRFDRSHLKGFGESGFVFEVVYIVTSPAYDVFMDAQQAIHLRVLAALDARGLEL